MDQPYSDWRADQEPHPNLLVQACLAGRYKEVLRLLAAGADANRRGCATSEDGRTHENITPLKAALLATDTKDVAVRLLRTQTSRIIKALLPQVALSPEAERELLVHCTLRELGELIDCFGPEGLFAPRRSLQRHGYELLYISMLRGHISSLAALTKNGCKLNLRSDRGNRPFLDVCSHPLVVGRSAAKSKIAPTEIARRRISAYLAHGLNIEATDGVGATPLLRALAYGNEPIAIALLECGANPLARMRNGVSALHLATVSMSVEFFRAYFRIAGDSCHTDLLRLRATRIQPDTKDFLAAETARTGAPVAVS